MFGPTLLFESIITVWPDWAEFNPDLKVKVKRLKGNIFLVKFEQIGT